MIVAVVCALIALACTLAVYWERWQKGLIDSGILLLGSSILIGWAILTGGFAPVVGFTTFYVWVTWTLLFFNLGSWGLIIGEITQKVSKESELSSLSNSRLVLG
jgi:hypothetical protein